MSKNIILCSDGTGNSAVKGRGTNVFKLYEALDLNDPQKPQAAFYDDGVGTESAKLVKLLGGAFGFGLARNVRQLYSELCRLYQPGDSIYLFGFSRGAFTVRTLAGLILDCGVPNQSQWTTDRELKKLVDNAYRKHREKYLTGFDKLTFRRFRRKAMVPKMAVPDIQFIGVWDTVDAVGFPIDHVARFWNAFIHQFKFSHYRLSKRVKKACHALAIDDERHSFHPSLWNEVPDDGDRIEQVWFAGVHSNVGGGYPKQGMSLVALDWMMTRAEQAGLKFIPETRARIAQGRNVDDKLYDSRAGLAVYYRYKPRSIAKICEDNNSKPKMHFSAIRRIIRGTEGYAPGNLAGGLEIVTTDREHPPPGEDEATLRTLERRIQEAIESKREELAKALKWVWLRRSAHYVLLALTVGLPFAGHWIPRLPDKGLFAVGSVFQSVLAPLSDILGATLAGLPFGTTLWDRVLSPYFARPTLLLTILGALIALYLAGLLARTRIKSIHSQFWRGAFNAQAAKGQAAG